jgi:hypothetical protein
MPRLVWTRLAPRSRVAKKTEQREPALLRRAGYSSVPQTSSTFPLKRAARPPQTPTTLTGAWMLKPGAARSNTQGPCHGLLASP